MNNSTYTTQNDLLLKNLLTFYKTDTDGIYNPNNNLEVVKVYEITDGAIATSGTYERGAHIHDPLTGMIAIGAQSATVVGAEGWLCDAMATAVMVGGTDSVSWFGQSELLGYQLFGVNRHDDTAWEI